MLNKKYIIGGVIILVIIAGAVFFSRNNSSTPDASVLEKGVKNLTRESAAEMIEANLKVRPSYGKTNGFVYDSQLGHYGYRNVCDICSEVQMLRKLEEAGFAKIISEKKMPYAPAFEYLAYDFTEQAKPYFVKREGVSPDDKNIEVALAELVSVEVTGLTEPAVTNGVNSRMANYVAKYEATAIGKVLDEQKAGEEVKAQISFTLYDDGWRIAQ